MSFQFKTMMSLFVLVSTGSMALGQSLEVRLLRRDTTPTSIAFRKDVQRDLGFTREQKQKIAEWQAVKGEELKEFIAIHDTLEGQESLDFDKEFQDRMAAESRELISGLVTPQQWEQLNLLTLVFRYNHSGVAGLLVSDDISNEIRDLGIREEQKAEIDANAEKIRDKLKQEEDRLRAEYEQKLAELRRNAFQETIAPLTERQKETFLKLLDEANAFKDSLR